jgi:hypothetical protein
MPGGIMRVHPVTGASRWFVDIGVSAVLTLSGVIHIFTALDNEGEAWWLDSSERLPGPRWHPLPSHPRLGRPRRSLRRKRRK